MEVIRIDLDIVDDGVLEHHDIFGCILHRVDHEILGPLVIFGLQLNLQITGRDKEVGDVSVHPLMVQIVLILIVIEVAIGRGR